MKTRMEYWKIAPGAFKAMSSLEAHLRESGLDKGLLHMVKLRASQINGCAYCIDMHWKDARALGESEQRLYGLAAWEESPYYTDQRVEPRGDRCACRAGEIQARAARVTTFTPPDASRGTTPLRSTTCRRSCRSP